MKSQVRDTKEDEGTVKTPKKPLRVLIYFVYIRFNGGTVYSKRDMNLWKKDKL